jgi:hypothetical protein
MRSTLLESVTEAYSSLDLTKAKYSSSKLCKVGKEDVTVRIIPSKLSACEKENRHDDENEVCNQYARPNP